MSLFVAIGAVFAAGGIATLIVAIRHHHERQPRHTAMLIGGVMATAFGIVLAGFAIAYQSTPPLDLNTPAVSNR